MLESFLCFCLSTSRKGILGCAAGEGERVYGRAMEEGFGTLCAKRSLYSSSMGLHLAATEWPLHTQTCSRQCLVLPPAIPSSPHRAPQGSPSIPGGIIMGARGQQAATSLSCSLWWQPHMVWWPNHLCRIFLSEVGVGSSKRRWFSGWRRQGCLQPADGRWKHSQDRRNCDAPDENGDFFFSQHRQTWNWSHRWNYPFLGSSPSPLGKAENSDFSAFWWEREEQGRFLPWGSSHPGNTGVGGGFHSSWEVESGLWWASLA